MPHVMALKDGRNETVLDLDGALELVERYAGHELWEYLEEKLADEEELEAYLEELVKSHDEELEREGGHRRALLNDIREEAEALAGLLEAPRLDRKKLKGTAKNIWRMCSREL